MPKGRVKEYHLERGYGIVVDSKTGLQLTIYENYINLKKGEVLKEGQEVTFDLENNRHRDSAINVKILHKEKNHGR